MEKIDKYIHDGKYLPEPLQDFHDCKTIFKNVDKWIKDRIENPKKGEEMCTRLYEEMPHFMAGHIYVIDFFLSYMACEGYKLQKIRNFEKLKESN